MTAPTAVNADPTALDPAVAAGRFVGSLAPDHAPPEAIGILGVPYDGAVTYRAGAKTAPALVRRASDSIETYEPAFGLDFAAAPPVDLGDVDVTPREPGGRAVVDHIARQLEPLGERTLLAIGGDHLIAYPFLMRALARHPDLQILHIDAHADMRRDWDGDPFNHSTVLGRVLDEMPPTATLFQWGVRSGLPEEFAQIHRDPRIVTIPQVDGAAEVIAHQLMATGRPTYLTIDVDGLDPSVVPGTGTPEPGGLAWRDLQRALATLLQVPRAPGSGLVGADLVELAPGLDPTGVTEVVGARLVRLLVLALAAGRWSAAVR
jgi:agmatinase